MPAVYTVIYDACVFYPAPLRDFLMQLATARLFRARWTDEIHEEWIRSLLADRDDIKPEQLARTRLNMDKAVPDCLVVGYEPLIDSIKLPDKNDRHVVAAAIQGRADAIVTFNLKDFPPDVLATYGLEAIHPDQFIEYQHDLDGDALVMAAQKCRARLKNPPKTAQEYIAKLKSVGLPKTAAILSPYTGVI